MAYWLVKSEPSVYSWDKFVADGKTIWDGVRNYQDRNMMREIFSSEIVREPNGEVISYVVRGKSFLRYMVRKIVGTLIEAGKGRIAPGGIAEIFDLRDRTRSGPTVPPEGLYLVSLEFPDPTDSLAGTASRRRASTS